MEVKDLLIQLDDTDTCKMRVDAAVTIAQRFDAHLTGLYAYVEFPVGYAAFDMPVSAIEAQIEGARESAALAETNFEAWVGDSGLRTEYRREMGDPARTVSLHARYTDLVVCGQSKSLEFGPFGDNGANGIVLQSARPVLVIPHIGVGQAIGSHVGVAWNGSREAVRAVTDALPFLKQAEQVTVISVDPSADPDRFGPMPGAEICHFLARHDVRAEAKTVESGEMPVADAVLSQVATEGVDLLVMGAYGHSRFRELVLGGATQDMLETMTVPVLMSH